MKAPDLNLDEILEFTEGKILLRGRRLVLHPLHAFAQVRKDLVDMVGIDRARRILTRFGFYWGNADAAAMTRIFNWDSLEEWIKAGPRMHSLQGVTRAVVKSFDLDQQNRRFRMEVNWYSSGEAEEHLLELGPADDCVCWMLTGYASGYASFCLKTNIYFVEQKCLAKGDALCTAIGVDETSGGDLIKPVLPYYREVEHIQPRIMELTVQLRQKERQLARQRRRLDALDHARQEGLVEVHSAAFRRAMELADRVARFDSAVLITGESGAGKEVLAHYVHNASGRAKHQFLAINCGALPETLLESELFGHTAGAFTGAIHNRIGLFEQAHKGTIFLDEIGDVSPALQVKLLRVLQEKQIIRVGESKIRPVDVRIMAATNRNLPQAIQQGLFREDLFYRLAVVEIEVPPLRERREDILPLARHFVQRLVKKLKLPDLRLDPACLDYLSAYHWPGNVRELQNALERAAVLTRDASITPEFLPPAVLNYPSLADAATGSFTRTLEQVQNDYIRAVLRLADNNRTRAAGILGISPATLWRKLKHLEPQP